MKATLFTAAIATTLLASSCKKPSEIINTPSGNNKTTASVEGKAFTAASITAIANENNSTFLLTATDKDNNSIMISGPAQTGSFTDANGNATQGSYIDSNGALWMSSFGGNVTITVTKFDRTTRKMSGTFSFTGGAVETSQATGTRSVTGGTFTDVSFIQ